MKYGLLSQAGRFLQEQTKRRRWTIMFMCMAAAVALGTFGFLKLYGEAMTHRVRILECGYEAHEHGPECYEEDEEGNQVLVCGMADYVIHTHNDDCYDQNGKLVCPLEEHELHEHDESCYKEEKVLVCGMEEDEGSVTETAADAAKTTDAAAAETITADKNEETVQETEIVRELTCKEKEHTHDDSCYEEKIGCGLETHTHDDGCYKTVETLTCEKEEHSHDDSCYSVDENGESILACDNEEHTHDDSCYETEKVPDCDLEEHEHDDSCIVKGEPICGMEEHEHDDSCYTDTVKVTKSAAPAAETAKAAETTKAAGMTKAGTGAKNGAGHAHTDQCYETRKVLICGEHELHTHNTDPKSDDCCYSEDCFDKGGNLIEGSRPSCGLLQLEEHVHTKEKCFKTVELTPEEVAALNNGAKLHIHDDSCYDEDGKLICGHNATHIHGLECYDEDGELICGYGEAEKKEYRCEKEEHTHGAKCYDGDGNLTCEKEEHTHSPLCFLTEEEREEVEKVNRLIAELPSEEEITLKMAEYEEAGEEAEEAFAEYTMDLQIQIQEAYGAYLELDEELREYVTGADYLLSLWEMMGTSLLDETASQGEVPDYAAFLPVGEQGEKKSGMVLRLLYGDGQNHADKQNREGKPDGEEATYTKDGMQGSLKLNTTGILGTTTIDEITMSLYVPKAYMDIEETYIPEFPQTLAQHDPSTIEEVSRDGQEYYKISIKLKNYVPTTALTIPFKMKFKVAEVPADYELKIFAALERGEGDAKKEGKTAENTYRPKYDKPVITKYVNTNKFENMQEDHTRVSAKVNDEGIVESSQYVSFWYKLGSTHWGLRAYNKITLTDTLPTYVDNNGNTQYAVFDPQANPGWTDNGNHTVSRVFEVDPGWNPAEYDNKLMLQIADAELKLRFPNCKIDVKDTDGFLTKDLTNYVGAVCDPVRPSEQESSDTCDDDIIFTLTNQPGAEGWFAKGNSADTLMDTSVARSAVYRWSLGFENKSSVPLVNLVIGDEELDVEFGRLKFHSIIFNRDFIKNLDHVEAVTYGTETEESQTDIYDLTNPGTKEYFKDTGYKYSPYGVNTWTLTLDPKKEYKSFKIYFVDGFTVPVGGTIPTLWPLSTFRNPDEERFIEGEEGKTDNKNVYHNKAYIAYQDSRYPNPGDTYYFLFSENKFKLIENKENLWIEKEDMLTKDMNYPTVKKDGNGNLIVDADGNPVYDYSKDGTYNFCMLYVKGSLAADKEYKDLRVIDLLPEALELYEYPIFYGTGKEYIRETEVIENYHNSGRTALIFYLNVDEVRKTLDASDGEGRAWVIFTPKVRVKPDASPGTYYNDAYLLSDDLEAPPTDHGQTDDIYNLQGKGTDKKIRWDQGSGNIIAPAGIYAEKFIAKENSNDWKKTTLRFKVGDSFQYKLSMKNTTDTAHYNLTVYDVLPRIGDRSINNQAARESEFTVNLKGPLTPPEGYQVYYTASQEVYQKDMANLINTDIWMQNVTDWSTVTAFKFVANESVAFYQNQMDFIVPVKITDVLSGESLEILNRKEAEDRDTGTAVFLEATNSFGYSTNTFTGQNVESNYVKAQISLAGFVIQKKDENGVLLSGAEFKLEKEGDNGQPITGTTGVDGKLSFRNLTVGTYRLTETKAPDGYRVLAEPIRVAITLDEATMEYTVTAENLEGSGTGKNPFVVINEVFYELPKTGGLGITVYTLAGALIIMLGAGFMYKMKFRKRRV